MIVAGANATGIQLEGHRPRCPRIRMFHAFDVAVPTRAPRPVPLQVAGTSFTAAPLELM
jgi:hypothetical protein